MTSCPILSGCSGESAGWVSSINTCNTVQIVRAHQGKILDLVCDFLVCQQYYLLLGHLGVVDGEPGALVQQVARDVDGSALAGVAWTQVPNMSWCHCRCNVILSLNVPNMSTSGFCCTKVIVRRGRPVGQDNVISGPLMRAK